MISNIISVISVFVLGLISKIGYVGVFLLMALESANIPIPSEIIMPFSGFLAGQGQFNLYLLILVGALGNLFGSLISYGLAVLIGKPIISFLDKIPLFAGDYERAERFFHKYGNASVFWGRMLPIIRTFISFPAGIFKLPIWKFSFYTFIGSLIWSGLLAFVGFYLGAEWQVLQEYFHKFDYVIAILILALIIWYVVKKIKHLRKSKLNSI